MTAWRPVQITVVVASIAACVLVPGSATAKSIVLRGFGTPRLDGIMTSGEWNPAGHADFTVNRASSEGGGTVPATIYVMNDAVNLYIGIKVTNATVSGSNFGIQFGSATQEGSEYLAVNRFGTFLDMFSHQIAPNGGWLAVNDADYGGTAQGGEGEGNASGYSFYEVAHPLDDSDDAHDFSLKAPQRVAFNLVFRHCGTTCAADSRFPGPTARDQADIVVVSGSRIAPDTQITTAPSRLSSSPTGEFAFTGTDDVIAPADLTFECRLGEDTWRACTTPNLVSVDDGPNTFAVRAVDEMLNVDGTPAEWTWTVDSTGPSKPVVRRARSLRGGKVVLRFSARDRFTPANRIRFRCAVGSTRLHRCPALFRTRLRPGKHVVRAKALDRLGNEGATTTIRFTVTRRPR
jgi:hypothetical protein